MLGIKCEAGEERSLIINIRQIPGVKECNIVDGEYCIIVKIEAGNHKGLTGISF